VSKADFVAYALKRQAERKKREQREIDVYMIDAVYRMRRLYRGDRLRSKKVGET